MKRHMPFNEQVVLSSDDSSSSDEDEKVPKIEQGIDEPLPELSSEALLFRRAKSYQEYMKVISIPTDRNNVIPCNTWMGLGKSIKQIYGQPLHYLTNIHLKKMDQARLGSEDEFVPLDMFMHPVKAETSIWLVEEVHRLTASPHQLLKLWTKDPTYHADIDDIFPVNQRKGGGVS